MTTEQEELDRKFRQIPPLDHLIAWAPGDFPPLERLERLHELVDVATELIREDAVEARKQGATWAEVGRALGIKRQTAHQRFRA